MNLALRNQLSPFFLVCVLVIAIYSAPSFAQAIYTVNSDADTSDITGGNGICDTGDTIAGGAAECTLRAAIQEANADPGLDTINFNIPGGGLHTLRPDSALPIVTGAVVIDGTTQPSYSNQPLIEIDGINAGAEIVNGLELHGSDSTVKALTINRFSQTGLMLKMGSNNRIQGCFIGTNAAGDAASGNGFDGLAIVDSSDNIIGGISEAERNVISGNNNFGVAILNSQSTFNVVKGNYIGTDVTGEFAIPNFKSGVLISALVDETEFASDNTIGGSNPLEGNVISGNLQNGIEIFRSPRNKVLGNTIGLVSAGLKKIQNTLNGIRIEDAADNEIGGGEPGSGNFISGNGKDGIVIGGAESTNNSIEGNYIGVNAIGTHAIANGRNGVLLTSFGEGTPSTGTTVGGSLPELGNTISGNGRDGVQIGFGSTNNRILGNIIGVSAVFSLPVGNLRHGVSVFDSNENIIGGPLSAEANIISANEDVGIFIKGEDVIGNEILGNHVGTNPDKKDLGNFSYGIHIKDASETKIGGVEDGEGNTIAFNGAVREKRGHGIVIDGGTGNAIRANSIFRNAGRGIDLVDENFELATAYAFTVPDPTDFEAGTWSDADTGSNELQNYPVITSVTLSNNQEQVRWTLYAKPNTTYQIDIFSNEEADPSGFGESENFVGSTAVTTNSVGQGKALHTSVGDGTFGRLLSATATDPDNNTSEISMIDTDGDAVADQWEINGIDIDEDGVTDFPLSGFGLPLSNHLHRDVFVEVDAMECTVRMPSALLVCFAPTEAEQASLLAAYANVPNQYVNNPDKLNGVTLHLELDELIPHHDWVSEVLGDKVEGFQFFDKVKQNGSSSAQGGFGTAPERLNPKTIAAKKLFYRYAIFADHFGKLNSATNLQEESTGSGYAENTSGRGPERLVVDGGNDFFVTLGLWTINGGNSSQRTGTFMHELGHSLGLSHGGRDRLNHKPNYHSVMNYLWTSQKSNYSEGWKLDYSREPFHTLVEDNLYEAPGLGGDLITWVPAGPPVYWPEGEIRDGVDVGGTIRWAYQFISTSGAVDFNRNETDNDTGVSADLNYHGDVDFNGDGEFTVDDVQPSPQTLDSHADWGSLKFNFLGSPDSADGAHDTDWISEEITNEQSQKLESIGDSPGKIGFTIPHIAVNENAQSVTITIRRSDGLIGDVSVDYQTTDMSTTGGMDYLSASGTLDFIEGQIFGSFEIEILDDVDPEDDEVLIVQLSNPQGGAELGLDQFFLGIRKNDGSGDLQFTNPFFGEKEDVGSATITVVRTGGSNGVVAVDFDTADDLALDGDDYSLTSGTLVFADGVTSQTFVVPIIEDIQIEGNEGLQLTLSNPTGGAILGAIDEATLTILNVPTPAAEFNFEFPVYKAYEALGTLAVEVTRSKVLNTAVSVDFVTTDVTATMGADYTETNITLNFAANEVSKIVNIPILSDALAEGIETFDLRLTNPSQFALVGPIGEARVRIRDSQAFTVTNANDAGPGSLRSAIINANASANLNVIDFDIPGSGVHTIMATNIMPPVTEPVIIDGYTQIGASPNSLDELTNAELRIELDGSLIPANAPISQFGVIEIQSPNVTIRGLVINQFRAYGIRIVNTSDATIEGNFIGTDTEGLQALGISNGIAIHTSSNNQIGGATPAARNLISAAVGDGINIQNANGNVIMGNLIGVGADGSDFGNEGQGIQLDTSKNNTIGGPGEMEGNVIAFNRDAIVITGPDSTSVGNRIRGNSIYGSDVTVINLIGGGIVLKGWVNMNDAGDADGFSNNMQNYPVIGDVQTSGEETSFSGYLSSASNTPYTLDFYASPDFHPIGYGGGKTYLGSGQVITDGSGTGLFNIVLPLSLVPGEFITATATDPGENTSEFSLRQAVGAVLTETLFVNSTDNVDDGFCNVSHCSLHEAIRAANNYAGSNTINFSIAGAGPHTISPGQELPAITESVLIDGYSQPGAQANTLEVASNAIPLIEIEGSGLDPDSIGHTIDWPGLDIVGDNTTIRGLVVNRFNETSLHQAIAVRGTGHKIEGNFLATDITGTAYLGGGSIEVGHPSVMQVTIGGTDIGHRNLIADRVTIGSGAGHMVLGNLFGTDITGSSLLDPSSPGLRTSADGVVIGGRGPGEGNVIASGIHIEGSNSIVQGNLIGTDATGTQAIASQLPFRHGIILGRVFNNSLGNQIGGTSPGEGNVISGYGGHGIDVANTPNLEQNFIEGNFIGTDRSGTLNLGNQLDGIHVRRGGLVIGGETPGSGNIIAHNGGAGVSTDKINTLISQNSIYDNGGLGIDLNSDGVTPNDEGDIDTGGNNRQNFPVLDVVTAMNGETTVTGSLSGMANTSYRLEFFSNEFTDASGYGEGESYFGSTDVVTDNAGDAVFSPALPGELSLAQAVTATAADADGNTSEFSFRRALGGLNISADLSVSQTAMPEPLPLEVPVTFTVIVTNNGPDLASGVILSNPLVSDSVFISAESVNGSCSFADDTVRCPIGIIPVGGSAEATITYKEVYVHTLSNTVVVTGNQPDPDPLNSSNTIEVEMTYSADLTISKSADPIEVSDGEEVTYTLTVENLGPSYEVAFQVIDELPAGFEAVSVDSNRSDCSISAHTITCDYDLMFVGDIDIITIVATANGEGPVTNTAELVTTEFDPNDANNSASVEIVIGTQDGSIFADSFEVIEQ